MQSTHTHVEATAVIAGMLGLLICSTVHTLASTEHCLETFGGDTARSLVCGVDQRLKNG